MPRIGDKCDKYIVYAVATHDDWFSDEPPERFVAVKDPEDLELDIDVVVWWPVGTLRLAKGSPKRMEWEAVG